MLMFFFFNFAADNKKKSTFKTLHYTSLASQTVNVCKHKGSI
jgi:hypothetical protein